MECQGCPGHRGGEHPDLFVDIVLRDVDGNTKTFENVNRNKLSASDRTIQFKDGEGYLHVILLGGEDRVEITSREPVSDETGACGE